MKRARRVERERTRTGGQTGPTTGGGSNQQNQQTTGVGTTTGGSTTGTTTATVAGTSTVSINEEKLQEVSDAAVAVAPESMRSYAQSAIPGILRQCAQADVRSADQVAYILATAQHESRFGEPLYGRSESLVEDRNPFEPTSSNRFTAEVHTNGEQVTADSEDELETAYWDSAYGGRLGNEAGTTDARNYRGRGYVQLTGRTNYENMTKTLNDIGFSYTYDGVTYGGEGNAAIDLAAHPEHVNKVPELAARIMVEGMTRGSFTGVGMDDYINDQETDFTNARAVVNGDTSTNGASIGDIAETYQGAVSSRWAAVFDVGQQQA